MTDTMPPLRPDLLAKYQITVQGTLDPTWIQRFQEIRIHFDGEVTTIDGIVADQAALRGLICTLWDFNLVILSVVLISQKEG